ncbi:MULTISPECIES: uracil-DNA glycosylase [Clostridium]|uniref:Type-4 uracil-DNA glycosylase n=4 Tax=Clostridium TaxID=1485 RepID=D8GKS9_CLOLD|nr:MULTISPECIES: uracil-DNA glycosylase [Clostridium]ADK13262.1 predicted phage related DNA polymerase [Clostridium ljungdahlii DSM 13528]AGY76485.1 uracil-DNA glycosylase [Clostridium autoethanogenum DSM 10061]ALU36647.1 Phage SPO1 DNA polymerase-related protein [Clostridium autoethanogenum DSM 10061]OAA88880.1 Uracil DNA glycosylase superfamily protein [Clostridium ljungdahlii DSM 13528]OVY50663.1 Uracil DNA glycosylase superfamily protein [Clostridium autoethanogenum]
MLRWKELYEECLSCSKCSLGDNRTNMVFGDGNPKAHIMFIGEAPGADEDRTGIPFVGRAGQLLTKALLALDLHRERDYYICNICKCRPKNNRTPYEEEEKACIPYLRNQVALVRPKIIVCLGATAMGCILGKEWRITRDRGKWIERKGFYMTATFHPSAVLRDANKKAAFWEDLKSIKEKNEEIFQTKNVDT